MNDVNVEERSQPLPMLEILRKRLAHHEAKVGQIKEAIALVEAQPRLEQIYELLRTCKM